MFGWCSSLGFPSVSPEPDKERRAPSDPTPLDFPVYYTLSDTTKEQPEASLAQVYDILASIGKPQDITPERFQVLNLKVETDLSASCIVNKHDPNFFPPLPWEDTPPNSSPLTEEDGTPILMENGNPYPPKERYDVLKGELLLDNDDAFREVARLPPGEGRQRVRVTQTRKFWTGLERMAQYWDTSLDNYFERPVTPKQAAEAEPEHKMQTHNEAPSSGPQQKPDMPIHSDDTSKTATPGNQSADHGGGNPGSVRMYTGRRVGAGHEMPEDIREETIRAFTEMAAWPFGCLVALPILPPRLSIRTLLFPVRQTFTAARSPKDRQLARSGVMEGPVFTAQCRPETCFRAPEDVPGTGFGEVCDLFREVGGMLLAAQERARQGMIERRPGEGKWWTTTPRWGGAPNDAVGDSGNFTNGDERPGPDDGNSRKRSKYEHPFLASRRLGSSRKLSNSEKWKLVQPGPGLWDKRMRYIQIGKDPESPFDDIYMVSSINHHLAILHLRVHRRYIDIITFGESEFPSDSKTAGQPWHVLQLRRTKWYDLFNAEERVEIFKGLWSIFHHLLRRT